MIEEYSKRTLTTEQELERRPNRWWTAVGVAGRYQWAKFWRVLQKYDMMQKSQERTIRNDGPEQRYGEQAPKTSSTNSVWNESEGSIKPAYQCISIEMFRTKSTMRRSRKNPSEPSKGWPWSCLRDGSPVKHSVRVYEDARDIFPNIEKKGPLGYITWISCQIDKKLNESHV